MEQSFRTRSCFDREAQAYLLEREGQRSFLAQRELVLDLLPPGSLRVLDAGCGPAVMAEPLLDRAYQVYGVDLSPRMVAYARTRMLNHWGALRCHFSTGSIERLAFADGYFDAALSMGVLEYLPSHGRALAELHRVLRPGGTVVLAVSNRACLYHATRGAAQGCARRRGGCSGERTRSRPRRTAACPGGWRASSSAPASPACRGASAISSSGRCTGYTPARRSRSTGGCRGARRRGSGRSSARSTSCGRASPEPRG